MELDAELTEWDAICRICLEEGEMHSIFDFVDDNSDIDIASKIMMCSTIEIKKGVNFPEQICENCLSDLQVAYRFQKNCERSEAILQSFVDSSMEASAEAVTQEDPLRSKHQTDDGSVVVNSNGGAIYAYKPPVGLNIKRIKPESESTKKPMKFNSIVLKNEPYFDCDDIIDDDQMVVEALSDSESRSFIADEYELNSGKKAKIVTKAPPLKKIIPPYNKQKASAAPKTKENVARTVGKATTTATNDNPNDSSKGMHIEPVKVNKARLGYTTKKPDENGAQDNATNTQKKGQKSPKVCDICGNEYKYQHALDSHMRRHRNIKPYQCMVCGKGFVINFELNRHMRTHTGQKPYACKYCDRRFSDFGSRVKHERTHTGERPYACATCGKTFAYSHVLSSHNLIHTGEKKYHCDICGKRFAKSHHLKAHSNTHSKHKVFKPCDYIISATDHTMQTSSQSDTNENELAEYMHVTQNIVTVRINPDGTTESLSDQNSSDGQLLLYSDVDVLNSLKSDSMDDKRPHVIEDENGVQHEITIEEQQDGIELLTFEDDQLE